jgi:hypothetical protein
VAVIDSGALLADVVPLVRELEAELQTALEGASVAGELEARYRYEHESKTTGARWPDWRRRLPTWAACSWVLATVLLRFSEDNGLAPATAGWLASAPAAEGSSTVAEAAGTGDVGGHRSVVLENALAARAFDGLSHLLVDLTPLAVQALMSFWDRCHDFADPSLRTDFLADLYMSMSETERTQYALVPTPNFVSDLILDLTLSPALAEFGPENFRVIDPCCGSGEFMVEAFRRLTRIEATTSPGASAETVRAALAAVHGIDVSPVAVIVTRFRLLVEAFRTSGVDSTELDPADWPINVVQGDSLLGSGGLDLDDGFDAVVGEPPFITVKDPTLNGRYRELYDACRGRFGLTVPFTQRFFQLARVARSDGRGSGYVGMLTSNSFTKREFGQKLATDFLARKVSLTHILDTSGAYIPAHGTPTVMLIGRNTLVRDAEPLFVIQGKRGEPDRPAEGRLGRVWASLRRNLDDVGLSDRWTASAALDRQRLLDFPWDLSTGARRSAIDRMSWSAAVRLGDLVARIGYDAVTGLDDAFVASPHVFRRMDADINDVLVDVAAGTDVRDWALMADSVGFLPRVEGGSVAIDRYPVLAARLWRYRTTLRGRAQFAQTLSAQEGRPWYDWNQVATRLGENDYAIAYRWISTHSQFALRPSHVVALNSAPVIKLTAVSTRTGLVSLLGVLNSSSVDFWLKQHSHRKGAEFRQEASWDDWEAFYEFTAAQLRDLPLPADMHTWQASTLDGLAQARMACVPTAVSASGPLTAARLEAARQQWEALGREMVAVQEELDWEIYRRYGLLEDVTVDGTDFVAPVGSIPPIALGERAFEIALARQVSIGDGETTWFSRHGITPVVEIPITWPMEYRKIVERRISAIERGGVVRTLERPEFKRRWSVESWHATTNPELRGWLLDRLERRDLWFEERGGIVRPRPLTISRLSELLSRDREFIAVSELYLRGGEHGDLIVDLVATEHVPCLAASRYKDAGVEKYALWEATWDAQRREDAEGRSVDVLGGSNQPPPRYGPSDFRRPDYWRQRGKLDIPNERFISYPPVDHPGMRGFLLGWSGWTRAEQAQVLADLVMDAIRDDGRDQGRIIALLASLQEALPWINRERKESGPEREDVSDKEFLLFFEDALRRTGLTPDSIRRWRPEPLRRGRPKKESVL